MFLRRLLLTNFKNYQQSELEFAPGLNVFAGLNGMGKTNLLDAIYYCSMTRSFFHKRDHLNLRQGTDFFRLEAEVRKQDTAHHLAVKVKPGQLKEVHWDFEKYKSFSRHIGNLPCVMITPGDAQLILGNSLERRRLLDRTMSQISRKYLETLMRYNKLLKNRNTLLKEAKRPEDLNMTLLESYTGAMAPLCQTIFQFRAEMSDKLSAGMIPFYRGLSRGRETPTLQYQSQMARQDFDTLSRQNLQRDILLGRTSAGVHRDDLLFHLDEKELKKYASQGQSKSYLIALMLARYQLIHAHAGVKPLLLLDDIFDKLDGERSIELLKLMRGEAFGQIFITDCAADRIIGLLRKASLTARIFFIAHGKVVEQHNFEEE